MRSENLHDLHAFLMVARERSFTRAAAKLGLAQSTLSHTIRALESRLGVRLLTRSTRSVAPTEAGERLMNTIGPHLAEIANEVAAIREYRDQPTGTIRITTTDFVADHYLWPRLVPLLAQYPDVRVEISTDYRMVDLVAEGFDIGVRFGDQVAKDMIAVRISADLYGAIVASPDYIEKHGQPASIDELMQHNCITFRLASSGIYAWELVKDGKAVTVKVDGQTTFNGAYQMVQAAIDGCGLAFMTHDILEPYVQSGKLRWVMQEFWPRWPGLHVYYPSRRESSKALNLVIGALRVTST